MDTREVTGCRIPRQLVPSLVSFICTTYKTESMKNMIMCKINVNTINCEYFVKIILCDNFRVKSFSDDRPRTTLAFIILIFALAMLSENILTTKTS